MKNYNEILKDILELDKYFRHSKKFFRFIDDKDVGKYETRPYNSNPQKKFIMKFEEPITKEFQSIHNKIGHYQNQNYLIRLFEILNEYKIGGNINPKLKGGEDIRILSCLRNKFAHKLGKYNPNDENNRELLKDLMTRYKEQHLVKDEFPISQDKTISGILKGIKLYLNELERLDKINIKK